MFLASILCVKTLRMTFSRLQDEWSLYIEVLMSLLNHDLDSSIKASCCVTYILQMQAGGEIKLPPLSSDLSNGK